MTTYERPSTCGESVVDNVHYTSGCSSSIVAALAAVDDRAEASSCCSATNPRCRPRIGSTLRSECEAGSGSIAVCRYDDGRGHPFWFARSMFEALEHLHGDKAVWKLLESGRWPITEVVVPGAVPIDVDTWDDYARLLEMTS